MAGSLSRTVHGANLEAKVDVFVEAHVDSRDQTLNSEPKIAIKVDSSCSILKEK